LSVDLLKIFGSLVSKELKLHSGWVGGEIEDCFKRWIGKKENREEIPCFICWEVWKHRNLIIFENVFLVWAEFVLASYRTWENTNLSRS
jgi:hypothetical protein